MQLRPTPGGVFANGINLFLMMSGLASFASCVESNTDNTLMIYLPVITNILFSFKYLLLFSPKAPKEIFSITIFLASFTQAYSGGINYKTLHFSNKRHSCENPTIKTLVSSEYNCSMTMFNSLRILGIHCD